jgi:hypothetical protein
MKGGADSMGISMYQRFSLIEASLFLRCTEADLQKLAHTHKISYIQATSEQVDFFGFQLLEYLLKSVVVKSASSSTNDASPERIVRAKELQELTGLSRTTLWQLERVRTQ